MIQREISSKLVELAGKFPVISLTGPRQSGKTTLLKMIFPDKDYVSLEDLDMRKFAVTDPRGFFDSFPGGAIFDEVQRAPELFSYLQGIVDQHRIAGEFILSGSQNFLLMESISQSLAGRAAILKLLPFNHQEVSQTKFTKHTLEERIFTGGYPGIYDRQIAPEDFFSSYVQTCIERDIRQLKNIQDLSLFTRFLKLCAARTGQLLNIASLAADCGISHYTAQSWLSLLQTSYIVYLLQPHHINFSKRLMKMPKLYFYDTGLVCYLLNITQSDQLQTHYMRGALFENLIILEFIKHFTNSGKEAPVYFWRDKTGNEIDLLVERPDGIQLIEIKSAKTFHPDFQKNLLYYEKLNAGKFKLDALIVYGGDFIKNMPSFRLIPWNCLTF